VIEIIPFFAVDIDYAFSLLNHMVYLCQDNLDVRHSSLLQGLAGPVALAEFSLVKSDQRSDSFV